MIDWPRIIPIVNEKQTGKVQRKHIGLARDWSVRWGRIFVRGGTPEVRASKLPLSGGTPETETKQERGDSKVPFRTLLRLNYSSQWNRRRRSVLVSWSTLFCLARVWLAGKARPRAVHIEIEHRHC